MANVYTKKPNGNVNAKRITVPEELYTALVRVQKRNKLASLRETIQVLHDLATFNSVLQDALSLKPEDVING